MQVNGGLRAASAGATALAGVLALAVACSNGTSRREGVPVDAEAPCDGTHVHDGGSGSGSSINACDNGSDACGSNAQCRSCLEEGACADGPDPVWTGTECVCADSPEHCQLKFCCAIGFTWNPGACACIGPP
jgi:hypothetical protein